MKQINVRTLKIVEGLPPVAQKGDKISWDTEFFGQTKSKLHRPHGHFAYLGCTFDGVTVYYITETEQIQEFLDRIDAEVWILSNAKYDFTQMRRFASLPDRKKIWDVQLIEQIMFGGYYDKFSLKDMARRRLDIYLEKDVREEFSLPLESQKLTRRNGSNMSESGDDEGNLPQGFLEANVNVRTMSREQLEYSCIDVVVTWMVYQSQRAEIDENDLNIWKNIERGALWTVLSMKGLEMDVDAWVALYEKNKADAEAIQLRYVTFDTEKFTLAEALKKKKYEGINLGSWMQVKAELARQGYDVKSTGEDDIKIYADECEFVRDVLEFRGKSKASSTYGSGWIKNGLIEEDNRVYSDFYQMGASTGRFSSSKPNVENIPVRETPEFRKCFIAGKGNVLVDADWSAQEPRIAAYLSQDEQLLEIFKAKKDIYIEAARLMFGWEIDKKDPRRATRMKPTVLGASYGLTEYGMELKYGVPKAEGKELLERFFETFEGMREWKKKQQDIKDCVTTILGRKFWLNPYAKGSENNALNSPVQGSGGDGIKIAGAKFMEEVRRCQLEDDVFIVNFIHDEILVECKEEWKDWTMTTLKQIMIDVAESMHVGIPADVEVNFGHTWHDCH